MFGYWTTAAVQRSVSREQGPGSVVAQRYARIYKTNSLDASGYTDLTYQFMMDFVPHLQLRHWTARYSDLKMTSKVVKALLVHRRCYTVE